MCTPTHMWQWLPYLRQWQPRISSAGLVSETSLKASRSRVVGENILGCVMSMHMQLRRNLHSGKCSQRLTLKDFHFSVHLCWVGCEGRGVMVSSVHRQGINQIFKLKIIYFPVVFLESGFFLMFVWRLRLFVVFLIFFF